jgi:hypothetical protein
MTDRIGRYRLWREQKERKINGSGHVYTCLPGLVGNFAWNAGLSPLFNTFLLT